MKPSVDEDAAPKDGSIPSSSESYINHDKYIYLLVNIETDFSKQQITCKIKSSVSLMLSLCSSRFSKSFRISLGNSSGSTSGEGICTEIEASVIILGDVSSVLSIAEEM